MGDSERPAPRGEIIPLLSLPEDDTLLIAGNLARNLPRWKLEKVTHLIKEHILKESKR